MDQVVGGPAHTGLGVVVGPGRSINVAGKPWSWSTPKLAEPVVIGVLLV